MKGRLCGIASGWSFLSDLWALRFRTLCVPGSQLTKPFTTSDVQIQKRLKDQWKIRAWKRWKIPVMKEYGGGILCWLFSLKAVAGPIKKLNSRLLCFTIAVLELEQNTFMYKMFCDLIAVRLTCLQSSLTANSIIFQWQRQMRFCSNWYERCQHLSSLRIFHWASWHAYMLLVKSGPLSVKCHGYPFWVFSQYRFVLFLPELFIKICCSGFTGLLLSKTCL